MDWTPDAVRRRRQALGWTQQQLADASRVSLRTVGDWESGRTSTRNHLGMLDEVLGTTELRQPGSPTLADATSSELVNELLRRINNLERLGRARDTPPPAPQHAAEEPGTVYGEDEPPGDSAETG